MQQLKEMHRRRVKALESGKIIVDPSGHEHDQSEEQMELSRIMAREWFLELGMLEMVLMVLVLTALYLIGARCRQACAPKNTRRRMA